ncbi:hypothetical protein [Baekduia sp. Peel2402]|uniref:hypothetical protein n=1 Tax=Baekduia sp. Peel2402 TaxID=3458296 RepID=UPI00403EA80D
MSTAQRNDACLISVDPSTADILRRQTLIVLEANHYYFEELLEFGPEAQYALSVIYRDAFAVLDAIGWRRPDDPLASVDVPFTVGFVEQLLQRRYDLGHTNIDRLSARDEAVDVQTVSAINAAIEFDRYTAIALDRLVAMSGARLRGLPKRPSFCFSSE